MSSPPTHARQSLRGRLGASVWSALEANGAVNHFRPREALLREGERGGSLLLIAAGRVMVVSEPDGSGLLLALRSAGDLVGEIANERRGRTATVLAMDRCTTFRIPHQTFRRVLTRHQADAAYTDYLLVKLSEKVLYQTRLMRFPSRRRLARLLADIVALAGPELSDPLRVPCSQAALAAALGMSRSTVAHYVARLRADGVLASGPRLVVADITALHREACLEG